MFTYQASSLVTRPDAETNEQADRVNRDFKNAWPFAQQGFCSGVVSRFCSQEIKMNKAQLAVKNWDRKSSRPAAFAVREIAGFCKYWGIFECEDGSRFFWFGSTNTIAEEK